MLVTLALPRLPVLMSSLHCRLPEKAITWGAPHCPQVHLQQPMRQIHSVTACINGL